MILPQHPGGLRTGRGGPGQPADWEGHLTLGPAEEGIAGGLLLRRGRVDINCTFSMLLQRRRESLSAQVAEILFPRGEQV